MNQLLPKYHTAILTDNTITLHTFVCLRRLYMTGQAPRFGAAEISILLEPIRQYYLNIRQYY